jgi:hypothetical protein
MHSSHQIDDQPGAGDG